MRDHWTHSACVACRRSSGMRQKRQGNGWPLRAIDESGAMDAMMHLATATPTAGSRMTAVRSLILPPCDSRCWLVPGSPRGRT